MADKNTKTAKPMPGKMPVKGEVNEQVPSKPKKKKFKWILKITAILVMLVILGGLGFAAGVFFKIIDMHALGEQWNLSKYPVIGKYFGQPQTNFDIIDEEMQNQTSQPPAVSLPIAPQLTPDKAAGGQPLNLPNGQSVEPAKIMDAAELKKQIELKQKEDAKRISKLARLYGGMKPEEAVPILDQLSDATVLAILSKMEEEQVSKILAQMDAQRAARLTNTMVIGPAVVNANNNKGL